MKALKVFILLTVLVVMGSWGVSAAEDTYQTSVEKLLILTKQDQLVDQMFQQIQEMQIQQLQQMNVAQEQYPIMEKYLAKIHELMKAEMAWDKIKDDFIRIYMTVYTEQEIGGLIAFYESPLGQKTIDKLPLLTQQSIETGQKYFILLMPQIQVLAQEMAAEMGAQKNSEAETVTETDEETTAETDQETAQGTAE